MESTSCTSVDFPRETRIPDLAETSTDFEQTPLLILIFIAPESPWWLIRRGRKDEALRSIERLGGKSGQNSANTLAMMERTVEIEKQMGGAPTILDLFKGTDLRRTTITCLMYASQNFAGNLIANQATFFFEREQHTFLVNVSPSIDG